MKLSKTKKILLLGTTLVALSTSIAVPIVLLNKDEQNQENDVEKLFKILQAKTVKEKIIELPSSANGKIIANNQNKIVKKIKTLIGQSNLKKVKIEVSMQNDVSISTTPQKIIIKITKNQISKEIKDFLVKKRNVIDEEIESIKKILDAKTDNGLIILRSSSSGNIIENATNKDAILKKLRMLIDPLNINGNPNHPSLKGTSIQVSMSVDAPISTTPQNIIVSISKAGGATLRTTKTFQVKKESIADEDIRAIKNILDNKALKDLIIILPNSSTGNIIGNAINKDAVLKKLRTLIDSSNTNGNFNHSSLRGTSIQVLMDVDAPISTTPQNIIVEVSKTNGTTLRTSKIFRVKRAFTPDEDIGAIKEILIIKNKKDVDGNDFVITFPNNTSGSIVNNPSIKNTIERKVRIVIDPSNINGDPNHASLRGTTITLVGVIDKSIRGDFITFLTRIVIIRISKTGGTSLDFTGFLVKKSRS